MEALGVVDALGAQELQGLLVLDAFGDGLEPKAWARLTIALTTWRFAGLVTRSRTNSMSILR